MEAIRGWVISLSVSSVALGLILLLSPSGKTAKLVKLAASLFLLITVFSPLLGGGLAKGIDEISSVLRRFDAESYGGLGDGAETSSEALTEAVKEAARRVIDEKGLDAFITDAVIICKEGEYILKGITVKGADAPEAKVALSEALGISLNEITSEP